MKVAVIGLDSADWALLDRWSHHLPHIASIRRDGVSGRLTSCRPPVTIPAWKCYSTGKNPGKLGIYWFAYPDFQSRSLELNLPGDMGGNLWDYIPKSLVINTPGTFPPRTIDGILIAGFPCHGDRFATPSWIQQQLRGYRVNTAHNPLDPEFPEEALELIRSRFTTFHRYAPHHNFGQVTVFYIDELHHIHGSDSIVLEAWRLIDEEIGRVMEVADNVVLVSDHGSGPLSRFVNVVPSLQEVGAFRLRPNPWRRLSGVLGATVPRVPPVFRRMGEAYTPPKLRDAIRSRVKAMHHWVASAPDQYRIRVDWSSPLLPLNQGLIYRNPESARTDRAVSNAAEVLGKLPGVTRLWRKEEIYSGPLLGSPPDLWIETEPGVELAANFDAEWETKAPEKGKGWIGNHRQDGIFAFLGEDVASVELPTASIYDMCPTILSFYGLPATSAMDGRALPVLAGSGDDPARGAVQEP